MRVLAKDQYKNAPVHSIMHSPRVLVNNEDNEGFMRSWITF